MGGGGDQKVLKKFYLRRAIFNRYDPPCNILVMEYQSACALGISRSLAFH